MEPRTEPISKNIPIRTLVILSLTYAEADPLDVAIVEIMLAPMAYSMGTLKPIASTGTTSRPPPTPTIDPTRPATIATRNIRMMYSSIPITWRQLLVAPTLDKDESSTIGQERSRESEAKDRWPTPWGGTFSNRV